MSLSGLADLVLSEPVLADVLDDAKGGRLAALDVTGPESLRPFVVTGLVRSGRTVLAVTATSREAEDLVEHLADLLPSEAVAYYPSWETLPHERLSPRSDTVGRRLAVLRRLRHPDDAHGELKVVVAPVRSVLQPAMRDASSNELSKLRNAGVMKMYLAAIERAARWAKMMPQNE